MALVATVGLGAMLLNDPLNPENLLDAIALACLSSSILLNPALVQGSGMSVLSGKRVPVICQVLGLAAVAFFVLSRAVLAQS